MRDNVLFVDDEENILNSVQRLFADLDVQLFTANSAKDALRLVGEKEIAVLVSDNRMPEMNGIELMTRIKEQSPGTVKILMTGYADLPTALQAINVGEVFRFILKPWENEALIQTVREGLQRYRVVRSLTHSDEAALLSLAQAIELKDLNTRGHCDRVAGYALLITARLDLPEATVQEIKYGSWLHDCGKIGVPDAVLNFAGKLNAEDFSIIKHHPVWGADLARQARLSQTVINIILHHHERFDGGGYPLGLCGARIPLEARIVTIADIYDALTSKRPYREALSSDEALALMNTLTGNYLDPELMAVFRTELERSGQDNLDRI